MINLSKNFDLYQCLSDVNQELANFEDFYDQISSDFFNVDIDLLDKFVMGFGDVFQSCFGVKKDMRNITLCINDFLPFLKELKLAKDNMNTNDQTFYAITLARVMMQSNQSFGDCKKKLNLVL